MYKYILSCLFEQMLLVLLVFGGFFVSKGLELSLRSLHNIYICHSTDKRKTYRWQGRKRG